MKYISYIFLVITLNFGAISFCNAQQANTQSKTNVSTENHQKNLYLFIEANNEKNFGDLKKAEYLYEKCIEADSTDAASMYELAQIYLTNSNLEEAKTMAEKAIKIDTVNTWYKLLLANIYKKAKLYPESISVLEKLVAQNPGNIDFVEELAYDYIMDGEAEKALNALNVIENKVGVNEQLAVQKQKLYVSLNKVDSAVMEIEKLINEFPGEPRYYALLAELCMQNNLDKKALDAYNKIVEIDPENAFIHISLSDFYRKSGDSLKAFQELKLGFENSQLDLDSKIQILLSYYSPEQVFEEKNKQAFELVSLLADKYPENSKILSIKAEILYRAREFEKAKDVLEKIISIDTTLSVSWEQLLITESALSDFKSLEKNSLRAIRLFPDRPIAYLFAGMMNFQDKKYDEALNFYKKGLACVRNNIPLSVQFYSSLGDTYHELKNDDESDQAYESALILDPENSVVLNNYAYYLALRSEHLDRAKQMAFKAVKLDSVNASNLDTKAWVLYKMKQYEEARGIIEKAMKISKQNSSEVYEHYGDILYKLGETQKAVKQWKIALKKGTGSEFLMKKIREKKLYE